MSSAALRTTLVQFSVAGFVRFLFCFRGLFLRCSMFGSTVFDVDPDPVRGKLFCFGSGNVPSLAAAVLLADSRLAMFGSSDGGIKTGVWLCCCGFFPSFCVCNAVVLGFVVVL
ncbi:hypothetical protein A2U01_0035196, partial [Trifolium medium]|nr:hypothetical protein [Trifolium medium]